MRVASALEPTPSNGNVLSFPSMSLRLMRFMESFDDGFAHEVAQAERPSCCHASSCSRRESNKPQARDLQEMADRLTDTQLRWLAFDLQRD